MFARIRSPGNNSSASGGGGKPTTTTAAAAAASAAAGSPDTSPGDEKPGTEPTFFMTAATSMMGTDTAPDVENGGAATPSSPTSSSTSRRLWGGSKNKQKKDAAAANANANAAAAQQGGDGDTGLMLSAAAAEAGASWSSAVSAVSALSASACGAAAAAGAMTGVTGGDESLAPTLPPEKPVEISLEEKGYYLTGASSSGVGSEHYPFQSQYTNYDDVPMTPEQQQHMMKSTTHHHSNVSGGNLNDSAALNTSAAPRPISTFCLSRALLELQIPLWCCCCYQPQNAVAGEKGGQRVTYFGVADATTQRKLDIPASFAPGTLFAFGMKLVALAACIATLAYSWIQYAGIVGTAASYWFLAYFESWVLIASCFYMLQSTWNTVTASRIVQPPETASLKIQWTWILYEFAVHGGLMVTILYWAYLYRQGSGSDSVSDADIVAAGAEATTAATDDNVSNIVTPTAADGMNEVVEFNNIMMHGGVVLVVLLEGFLINRIPIRMNHWYAFVLPFEALYIGWTVLYSMLGLNNSIPLYADLFDWNAGVNGSWEWSLVYTVIGLFPLGLFVHYLLWFLSMYQFISMGGFGNNGTNGNCCGSRSCSCCCLAFGTERRIYLDKEYYDHENNVRAQQQQKPQSSKSKKKGLSLFQRETGSDTSLDLESPTVSPDSSPTSERGAGSSIFTSKRLSKKEKNKQQQAEQQSHQQQQPEVEEEEKSIFARWTTLQY